MVDLTIKNDAEYLYVLKLVKQLMIETDDNPQHPYNNFIDSLVKEIKSWEDKICQI